MTELAAVCQVFLAGMFILSGGMKLADRHGSRHALLAFGVPEFLASPFGRILPVAELAVSAALLVAAAAWWGAVVGVALLSVFTVGVAYNLARGRRPECNCFGSVGAGRIGPHTLARNLSFLTIAGFVIWAHPIGGGWGLDAWIVGVVRDGHLWVLPVALLAIAAGIAGLVAGVRRRQPLAVKLVGSTLRFLGLGRPGLPLGAPAPDFAAQALDGTRTSLAELAAGGLPILLIFTSPGCSACERLLPSIGNWQRDLARTLRIVLVTHGDQQLLRANLEVHGLVDVLLQNESDASQAYQAFATPSAVLIGRELRVESRLAAGDDAIRDLIGSTTGSSAAVREPVRAAVPGDPAPSVRLLDADGRLVDLADYHGRPTAVLFFSPDCPHARQLLAPIAAWEADPPLGAPSLLVVTRGSWSDNRDLGFRAPVVLDASFVVAAAFGSASTPSAVLIDADGIIASGVARGTRAVQALLDIPFDRRVLALNAEAIPGN